MIEENDLPKGMKKVPDEYVEQVEEKKQMNHSIYNYSSAIREALDSIEGLEMEVKQVEIIEAVNAPALISLAIEVREK